MLPASPRASRPPARQSARVQVLAVDAPNERAHFRQPRLPPIRLAHSLRPIPQLVGTAIKLSRIGPLPRVTKMRGSLSALPVYFGSVSGRQPALPGGASPAGG